MSKQNLNGNSRPQNLTRLSLGHLFNSQPARIHVFDFITHGTAAALLSSYRQTTAYYSQAVHDIASAADFFGLDESEIERVIRKRESELFGDGLLVLRDNAKADAMRHMGLEGFYGSRLYLLPPRALLKLSLFLPGTVAANRYQNLWDYCVNERLTDSDEKDWNATVEKQKIRVGTRIANGQMVLNQQKAKTQGVLAHVSHFGHQITYNTWVTLLTYKGEFPPPRGDIWVSRISNNGSETKAFRNGFR